MATESPDSKTAPGASRTSAYLRALKVPAAFLLVGLGLVAAYYSLYVSNSLAYLKGRDLRLLSTLGSQIQGALDYHETVLSNFSTFYRGRRFAEQFQCIVKEAAGQSIAMFAYVSPDRPGSAGESAHRCTPHVQPDEASPDSSTVRARFIDDAGTVWTRADGPNPPPASVLPFRVPLTRVLEPLFNRQVPYDVFDALVLATPSGRVIYAQGSADLRLTSLDGLRRRQSDGSWKEQPFPGTGRVSQVLDVQISGGQYVLYVQPCCTNLSDVAHPDADPGWVVAALTDSGKLRSESLAVSFSVMAFTGGLILLGIFSWPFLKLSLMAQEQRLRLIDVLVVGICSLLGIALVMLFLVDWYTYERLKNDLDQQLREFSREIQHNVGEEIAAAYKQMRLLDTWANPPPDGATPSDTTRRVSNLFREAALPRNDALYPFFESFALIAPDGRQRYKWATAEFTTPLVSTASREYFQHWLDHRVPGTVSARISTTDAGLQAVYAQTFLESIRSSTTGHKEAVLSMPTSAHPNLGVSVAALTIPMISLNDVALPPGFKFAVIDASGRVLFHSDPRRALDEQFFLETDSSRRLRSAVAARRDEEFNVRYFGQDYRAFVAPLASVNGSTWSLVTLFDRQLLRTVNIEWIVTTMLFTVIYASLYIIVCVVVLLFRPAYRAPWVWPDLGKREQYQHLIVVFGTFALAFAVAMYGLRGRHLLAFAWILPFIAWVTAYIVLSRPPGLAAWRRSPLSAAAIALCILLFSLVFDAGADGVLAALLVLGGVFLSGLRTGPVLLRPYVTAATLLLLLTALMPTMAFFEVAHAIQVDSYIKYGQLTLAKEVQGRQEQTGPGGQDQGHAAVLRRAWSRYADFFYDSKIVDAAGTDTSIESVCGKEAAQSDAFRQDPRYELPPVLEDILPYYSESSVGMRELLHDRSSDQAWDWHREGSALVLHTPPDEGWTTACVRSELPGVAEAGLGSLDTAGNVGQIVGLSALLLFTVWWIVRFATRKIFLIDVIEPLWARRAAAIPVHPGQHLFIVWRPADRKDRGLVEDGMSVVDLAAATEPARDWFEKRRDEVEQLPTGQTLVIDHLEARAGDATFDGYKLALVRDALDVQHRTVVLISGVRPSSFMARLGSASAPDSSSLVPGWTMLLRRFTVLGGVQFEGPPVEPARVSEVAASATVGPAPATPEPAADFDSDPIANSVWQEVHKLAESGNAQTDLDLEQMYEELGDRLDNYHRGIWESCPDAQKLVLQHLAHEGLINEKNRRTVRLLLARGLIRKHPNFRFASETFRRFVLWRVPPAEAAAIEQRTSSAWDTIRLPFLITLMTVSVFFFLTQRELFTTSIAVITALAGGIPALVRVAGLFARTPERETRA
jgi:hypothetical protein